MKMKLEQVWKEFEGYDGKGTKNFQLPGCRVQFYKGAMEIPLIAFFPDQPMQLDDDTVERFTSLVAEFSHELDCVEEGANYKINRTDDKQYLGRITNEALKLHAERIKELGWDTFEKIVDFTLEEKAEA